MNGSFFLKITQSSKRKLNYTNRKKNQTKKGNKTKLNYKLTTQNQISKLGVLFNR